MLISNSPQVTPTSLTSGGERPSLPEQQLRVAAPNRRSANASIDIDPEQLQRRAEANFNSRVQRLNDIESAPLKTQQALNSYQQTLSAAQALEYGELVGVDVFA